MDEMNLALLCSLIRRLVKCQRMRSWNNWERVPTPQSTKASASMSTQNMQRNNNILCNVIHTVRIVDSTVAYIHVVYIIIHV